MDELLLEKLYEVRKAKDKPLIRRYEKGLIAESASMQGKFIITTTITYRKDDVK